MSEEAKTARLLTEAVTCLAAVLTNITATVRFSDHSLAQLARATEILNGLKGRSGDGLE